MSPTAIALDCVFERYERTHSPAAVRIAGRLIRRSFRRGPGTSTLREVQQRRLQRTVAYAAQRSPFYRGMFRRLGLSPAEIGTRTGLRRLPFTTADDLREWRQFLCVPEEQLAALYTTSGATGEPKRVYFTHHDIQAQINLSAAALRAGHPGRLVALIALPMRHGLWVGWQSAMQVVQRAGGLALPVGADDLAVTLRWMQRTSPTAVFSSPSHLIALTRLAEQGGYRARIPQLWVSGEPLAPARQERLAGYWQAQVMDAYGATEIGGAQGFKRPGCRAHHLNALSLVTEIVDPATGEPAAQGELVYTTLLREAMPLLRYRSGDLGAWTDCGCRIPLPAIQLHGRVGDMLIAGDMHLYATAIAAAVGQLAGTDGRIHIRLSRVDLIDHMALRVAGHGVDADAVRAALYALYAEMRDRVRGGSFLLDIEPVADLGDQVKGVVVADER